MTVQASLFDPAPDVVHGTVGVRDADRSEVGPLAGVVRHRLARGAWVDLMPGWVQGGDVMERLLTDVPWHAERRPMYDRVVDVPRLLCQYAEGEPLPHPALEAARDALNAHYVPELGEPLVTAGLCLYRDGGDSVAWHGDTIGRGRSSDTIVAILSLGSPRELLLRPRGGGAVARAIAGAELGPASGHAGSEGSPHAGPVARTSTAPGPSVRAVTGAGTIRHTLHHGDLLVMGGSCQRTWEHAIPKTTRSVGPRISIQFRARGVS